MKLEIKLENFEVYVKFFDWFQGVLISMKFVKNIEKREKIWNIINLCCLMK